MKENRHKVFPDTVALVLCGGLSNRMGFDKSMLQYYDKPQRYHMYEMLELLCEKVFISCNAGQAANLLPGYSFLPDDEDVAQSGPMGALLTAFRRFPGKNILLTGCDYPFLTADELGNFAKLCGNIPASFYNTDAAIYESMIAWYTRDCADELKQLFAAGELSLQRLLKKTGALQYVPADKRCIISVDTREAFEQTLKQLKTG